jgi:hypothetical protein
VLALAGAGAQQESAVCLAAAAACAGVVLQQEEAAAAVVEPQQELPVVRFSDFWIRFAKAAVFFADMMQASFKSCPKRRFVTHTIQIDHSR